MESTFPPSPAGQALRGAVRAFLGRVEAFCTATARQETGVSAALFGSNRKIAAIRAGKSVEVPTLAAAEDKLARLAAEAGITLPEQSTEPESAACAPRPLAVGE